jgi:hypothetical protein
MFVSQCCFNSALNYLTIYALLVGKCLTLLRLIPVQDQTVSERQRRSSIRSRFIAVEERARKCSLNVTNSLLLELVRRSEGLRHLSCHQHSTPRKATPQCTLAVESRRSLTNFLQASRWGSGMLASTLLMSLAPKPVTVRLCFGRVMLGPTGPWKSAMGALVEGLRSRGDGATAAILRTSIAEKRELLRECRCRKGDGGVEGRMVRDWRETVKKNRQE